MGKANQTSSPAEPSMDEYQTREDVDRLMRADEVHQDKDRHKRAVGRLSSTLKRLTKKHGRGRGRSSGR